MTSLQKGLIIGAIILVIGVPLVLGVVVGVGVIGWKSSRRAANETATLQQIRTIQSAELQFYNAHTRYFGTFDELVKESLLDGKFSGEAPLVDGYVFVLKVRPRTTTSPASYTLNADPANTNSGTKHYYVDSSSDTIHVNADQPAEPSDPAGGG